VSFKWVGRGSGASSELKSELVSEVRSKLESEARSELVSDAGETDRYHSTLTRQRRNNAEPER
jgi:hypothetical protein